MVASEFGDALWPDAPSMHFDDCDIHGMTVHVFDAEVTGNYDDRAIFTDCQFFDTYMEQAVSNPGVAYPFLINTNAATIPDDVPCPPSPARAGALEMTNCRFTTCGHLKPYRIFGGPGPTWYATLTDCTYHFDGNDNSGMINGNLHLAPFTNFRVEWSDDWCSDPRCNQLVVIDCNGLTCWDLLPDPSGFAPPLCPPQYHDPVISSPAFCVDCDDPLPTPCSGHPDWTNPDFCDPENIYPCCDGCVCYQIEPLLSPCE